MYKMQLTAINLIK